MCLSFSGQKPQRVDESIAFYKLLKSFNLCARPTEREKVRKFIDEL